MTILLHIYRYFEADAAELAAIVHKPVFRPNQAHPSMIDAHLAIPPIIRTNLQDRNLRKAILEYTCTCYEEPRQCVP
jgi:hypothetical protein